MMQLHVSGRLVRDPVQKTSAGGKAYVQGLVMAGSGDGDQLVTLMAFDTDLANLLASLRKGDTLSAIGNGSVRAYSDKEGKPAVGINVIVSRLMTMATKEAAPWPRSGRREDRQQYRRTGEFMVSAGPREFAPDPSQDSVPF